MQIYQDVLDTLAHILSEVAIFTQHHATLKHLAQVRVIDDYSGSLRVNREHEIDQVEKLIDNFCLLLEAQVDPEKDLLVITITVVLILDCLLLFGLIAEDHESLTLFFQLCLLNSLLNRLDGLTSGAFLIDTVPADRINQLDDLVNAGMSHFLCLLLHQAFK